MALPSLAGRTAVVTGGASGIGRACAIGLARAGARVAVLDVNGPAADAAAEALRALGADAIAVACDVTQSERVTAAAAAVRAALGPPGVLVNSHGISGFGTLPTLAEAEWLRMVDVHLHGVFRTCTAFVGDMLAAGWGRIVNVSSVGGLRGGPMLVHYAAAKAGVIGFTKALAIDVGPRGVTVNVIAPGLVDTPMLRASGLSDEVRRATIAQMPIRRLGTPEDVAAACLFLVSEEAGWFTGQVLSPNGGGHL
jgi:NAD(P)-dependent dehydrogenase (short-subunit alcohol dehydrogenase family)